MLYCISDARFPMSYVSSGNLVSEGGFVHPRRILDTFVFILVQQGTLHITQGQKNYSVHSNEFIILFPDRLHYGYRPCEGKLSYYWVHFNVTDPHYCIYNRGALLRHEEILNANPTALNTPPPNIRALPAARIWHPLFKSAADFAVCAIAGHFQTTRLPHDMEFSLCPEPAAHGAFLRSPDHPADRKK